MPIVTQILSLLPGVSRVQRAFLLNLFVLWPCVRGRKNFCNLARYSPHSERTFRRHFAKAFDWGAFNALLLQAISPPGARQMLAYDHSFVPKSGKKTPGLDWFYNGTLGHTQRGLELGLLAVVNLDTRTAYALHAKQSPQHTKDTKDTKDTKECKSVAHLRECRRFCPPGVKHLAVDGAFARRSFVDGASEEELFVVSKARPDANLRYLFTGQQKPRGRRKLYDGKVFWGDLDLTRWHNEGELEKGIALYSATVYSVSLKRTIRVALLLKPASASAPAKKPPRHTLLFSTDLSLSGREIVEMYRARFQIEFLFRDAKQGTQGTGLTHCQSRDAATLHFHWNAAFAALNLAKIPDKIPDTCPASARFSWASLHQKHANAHFLQFFCAKLDLDWTWIKSHPHFHSLLNYGVIQP